jgi:hypothetical protein
MFVFVAKFCFYVFWDIWEKFESVNYFFLKFGFESSEVLINSSWKMLHQIADHNGEYMHIIRILYDLF